MFVSVMVATVRRSDKSASAAAPPLPHPCSTPCVGPLDSARVAGTVPCVTAEKSARRRARKSVLIALSGAFLFVNGGLGATEWVLRDGNTGSAGSTVAAPGDAWQTMTSQERKVTRALDAASHLEKLLRELPATPETAQPVGELQPLNRSSDRLGWRVENETFLLPQMQLRHAPAPYLIRQVPSPEHDIAKALKVLVVGDSFVEGQGVEDLDRAIPYRLERLLNDRTHPNAFRVRAVGKGGAGLAEYASWLTPQRMKEIDPDVVLVLFYENDAIPQSVANVVFDETTSADNRSRMTMSVYRECLAGQTDRFSSMVRRYLARWYPATADRILESYCNTTRLAKQLGEVPIDQMVLDPTVNPYIDQIERSARQIVINAGDVPVLAVPVSNPADGAAASKINYSVHRGYPDLLSRAGMTVAGPDMYDRVEELYERAPRSAYAVNPLDSHYGPALADAFARTAADLVLQQSLSIPATGDQVTPRRLVTNFMPVLATLQDVGQFEVRLGYDPRGTGEDLERFTRGVSDDGGTVYSLAPCMRLGRPHLQVMLNPSVASGKTVHIQLLRSEVRELSVTTVGYDAEQELVIEPLRGLRLGETVSFPYDESASGVMVGTTRSGCPVQQDSELPRLILRIWVD